MSPRQPWQPDLRLQTDKVYPCGQGLNIQHLLARIRRQVPLHPGAALQVVERQTAGFARPGNLHVSLGRIRIDLQGRFLRCCTAHNANGDAVAELSDTGIGVGHGEANLVHAEAAVGMDGIGRGGSRSVAEGPEDVCGVGGEAGEEADDQGAVREGKAGAARRAHRGAEQPPGETDPRGDMTKWREVVTNTLDALPNLRKIHAAYNNFSEDTLARLKARFERLELRV